MSEVEKTTNVVQATNKPNLFERLEAIQGQLVLCEKALAEYLETKRLAFPRFYFVSSADLLDILSNGNNPTAVMVHLTKLFDSMAKLKFEQDDKGENTKTALGMYSKDSEYVDMAGPCDCNGQVIPSILSHVGDNVRSSEYSLWGMIGPQVEVWLNRLLDSMKATILHELGESVVAYEEKPREQWLFDFPAQVALCGSQIWWTIEVNIAFGRLEEGYENALRDFNKKQVSLSNCSKFHSLLRAFNIP